MKNRWFEKLAAIFALFVIFAIGVLCQPLFHLGASTESLDVARRQFAAMETARFIDEQMPRVAKFANRFGLLRHALSQVSIANGLACEFGVFRGESINFIAAIIPNRTVHGFDSFEGNPEDSKDFGDWKKGSFDLGGNLPKVRKNVTLHKGWFDKSIPGFAAEHREPMAFMHMDADLYSSTKTVFDLLHDRIGPGTVIVFDEFFNYPGWKRGEAQAFMELVGTQKLRFEYLGYSEQQVAVRIL